MSPPYMRAVVYEKHAGQQHYARHLNYRSPAAKPMACFGVPFQLSGLDRSRSRCKRRQN